jgi:molecular chaperone GrpE
MEKENKKEHQNSKKEHSEVKECPDKTVTIKESEYALIKQEAEKAKEYWDKYLRLQADFENTRKRWERDKSEILRYANDDLLCDLLNVIDDLERSVELSQEKHEDFTAFLKGVEMILSHLHDLLKSNGVSAIEAEGKIFDPNYHEALMQVERNDLAENTIIEELQKGYLLNGKVIRTAKVKVSKKKVENKEENKNV